MANPSRGGIGAATDRTWGTPSAPMPTRFTSKQRPASAIVATSPGGWLALDLRDPSAWPRHPAGVDGRGRSPTVEVGCADHRDPGSPFGRRAQMITLPRALGITGASTAASPEAAALGTFTLLVYQQFRPRLDRLADPCAGAQEWMRPLPPRSADDSD